MLHYEHNPESKWIKMEWHVLVVLYSPCFLFLHFGIFLSWKGSDYFNVMLVVCVKAQFWKKTDKSIKGRTPWPGTAIPVSLSPHLLWVTSCCPVSGSVNWRENCKPGLKFKESWQQARCNKLWDVSCLHWAKAPSLCVTKWCWGNFKFYLHCTPALLSTMTALSLESRQIYLVLLEQLDLLTI